MSVANLLSNHEKLHAAFAHSPFIQTNSMAMTKADETFLKTLNEVIVANMQIRTSVWTIWRVCSI